jgi:NAD+ synthase
MPEREPSSESLTLGRLVADHLGINNLVEDISPILEGTGCYRRWDEMIRTAIPEYGPECKCKIVLPELPEQKGIGFFSVVALSPDGRQITERLTAEAYLEIVATNFKQRGAK